MVICPMHGALNRCVVPFRKACCHVQLPDCVVGIVLCLVLVLQISEMHSTAIQEQVGGSRGGVVSLGCIWLTWLGSAAFGGCHVTHLCAISSLEIAECLCVLVYLIGERTAVMTLSGNHGDVWSRV